MKIILITIVISLGAVAVGVLFWSRTHNERLAIDTLVVPPAINSSGVPVSGSTTTSLKNIAAIENPHITEVTARHPMTEDEKRIYDIPAEWQVDLETLKDENGHLQTEFFVKSKPANPSESVDSDNDGISDLNENNSGIDPLKPDTDGDGVKDGDEIAQKRNPLDPSK